MSRSRACGAIVLTVALAVGSRAALAPEKDALVSFTALTAVDGPVFIRHAAGDFSSAHEGDALGAGDTIRTGPGASAEITYFEGSSVGIDADAEVVVTSLRASNGGAMHTLGHVWRVVTKLISGETRYEVHTPSSTASARG